MARALKVFVELPVRRDVPNEAILSKLRLFRPSDIDGVVFSDKAGGLEHFCEAEDLVQRGLVRQVISQSVLNGASRPKPLSVWNVVRTGDRCKARLQGLLQDLQEQGSSGFILVSGHDYRTKLRVKAKGGELCSKVPACARDEARPSILCGHESRFMLGDADVIANYHCGAVLHDSTTPLIKPGASFFVTQACPPIGTRQWIQELVSNTLQPVFVTVIPILSLKELERVRALGSNIPQEVDRGFAEAQSPKDYGLTMAKQAIEEIRKVHGAKGIYLYHHDINVLVDLARHVKEV